MEALTHRSTETCCGPEPPEAPRERDLRERLEMAHQRLRIVEAQAELANLQTRQARRVAEDAQQALAEARRRLGC